VRKFQWLINTKYELRITGYLNFVHRSEFEITGKANVSENESVSIFRWKEGETHSLVSLERANLEHWFSDPVI
jgi:hypothetical protein